MKNPARTDIRPLLSAFVDGELGPQERLLVERHMASCPQSAQEVADLRALAALTRKALEAAAEAEDWQRFSKELGGQLLPGRLPFFQRLGIQLAEVFTYRRSWVLAGASTATLALGGLLMWAAATEGPAGYKNPYLSIKTVSTTSAALQTFVTYTETGDAIVWLLEETPTQEAAPPEAEEAHGQLPQLRQPLLPPQGAPVVEAP